MVLKYRFGKERYIKQINDVKEWQKNIAKFCCSVEKGHVCKESGIMTQGRREMEVTLLLGKDKNSVIAKKVLSYF